jgi:hypothetical protein
MLAGWALMLAGCSSNLNNFNFGDPASTGGASTVSQARGEAPGGPPPAFPAVHDTPPPRGDTILTDYEQRKLENDLIAARRKVAPDTDKPEAKSKTAKSSAAKSSTPKSDDTKSAASQKTGNKQDP